MSEHLHLTDWWAGGQRPVSLARISNRGGLGADDVFSRPLNNKRY